MTGQDRPVLRPDADQRDLLAADAMQLAWTWARRISGLGPDDSPAKLGEDLQAENARAFRLTLLAVAEQLHLELDNLATLAAAAAADAGADYAELGQAVGITRQGARHRWPGLAERTKTARDRVNSRPTTPPATPPIRFEIYVPNADAGAIVGHLIAAGLTGREAAQGREGVHIGLAEQQTAEDLRGRLAAAGYRPSEVHGT